MAKLKTQTTTKQKVITAIAIVAVAAAAFGILTAVGKSRGYGFGWPFVIQKKTYPEIPINPKKTAPDFKFVPPHQKYEGLR